MAVLTAGVQTADAELLAGRPASRLDIRERLAELGSKAAIACLFAVLAVRIGAEFLQTGHVTGLLLLVSELLVVLLTVVRRRATVIDRSWQARVVAATSIVCVPFIRPTPGGLVPDAITAAISAAGLAVVIAGKLSLGRSFGLMPANRGIVCSGVYRLVRHPIYAGYLATHTAFLVAHPSAWNLLCLVAADTALLVRAVYEERTLARDEEYAGYLARVRWRVLPGIF